MSKVVKVTIGLMAITIVSKVLGFVRELVLGAVYGATSYSDAYIIAMNIPIVLFSAIGASIATIFIPLYYENKSSGGEKKSLQFMNNIINIVTILALALTIMAFIFTNQLVKVFAIGFDGEKLILTIKFTRIMLLGGFILILSDIVTSFLQTEEEFLIPQLISLPFNMIIIISIILSYKISIYILPIGTLIAMSSKLLLQLPLAYKKGYKYNLNLDIRDEYIKKIIWLVGPVFIGVGVNQVNAVIDRTLASTLVEGSISALNYANRLNGFVIGLFITSIASVIYPLLSKLSSNENEEFFIDSVTKSINSVIILVLPISIGAIVLSKPIVKMLFERGAFDERATTMTSIALVFYSIGMIGFGLRDILGKVFYSLKDTKTPMINGAISIGFNIILNIALVRVMGYAGLAFATSISSIICILLLFNSLTKKIGYFGQDKIIKTLVKSLVSACFMGIITKISYSRISSIFASEFIFNIIAVFTSIAIGAIVYVILAIVLKIEEIDIAKNMILKKIKK